MSQPSRRPVVVRNFFSRRAVAKEATALLAIAALLTTSCDLGGSSGPSAKERADALVHELEAIPDAGQRAMAAVITLNTMCSIGRVASGTADGPIEGALLAHYSALDPDVKQGVIAARDTVRAIPAAKRTALLGKFADLDPGSCDSAPNWPAIKGELQKAAFPVPRLRANYCSGGFTYADNTTADRAITSAHHSFGTFEGPLQVAAAAAPVILGVEGEHVTARHPALKATTTTPIENGISPFGVETDIPCSVPGNDSCDAAQGLICGQKFSGGGPHCIAFPVVQKDQDLVLRGYNFWDVTEAQLVLTPLLAGQGIESVTPVTFVDTNEPLDGNAACPPASATNPTHNRAHFRIGANEGHFYRVHVFNHNGTFRTEQDAQADAPPRDVHVCYPTGLGDADVPPGTIRDCVAPPETCPQDGAACSGTWTTPPRKVADCRHLPNQPPVCGETPEWFGNEPLTTRTDAVPPVLQDAVVFVIGDEPKFEIHATLDAIQCKDETGSTNFGSDEPLMLVAGFPMAIPPGAAEELLDKIDKNSSAFRGGNFDHGDREHPNKLLSTVKDVGFNDTVIYLVALYEDDEFLIGFLVGLVIIAAIAAIIALTGGTAAAVLAAAGGAALAGIAWTAIMSSVAGSDLIGRTTLEVNLTRIEERIGADHTPDFLIAPHAFGALPALANASVEKQRADPALIHPFVDARLGSPLQAKCDPGACPTPQTCLVNQCVDPGFADPTAGRGFKERREFFGSNGYYAVDLLWEKVPAQ